MKYKCVIADDNTLERDTLQLLLEKTGMVDVIACCKDGLEAYQILSEREVDIVFTDVDMPGLNGLELVKSLKNQPVFVFISAHASYAIDGFELDVADFILKPVQMERLLRALGKAKPFVSLKKNLYGEAENSLPKIEGDQFFIRTSSGLVQINHADITHIESAGNFSKIYTVQGHCHLTLVSLKNLVVQLPETWLVRIHRQFIINIRQISQIETASVKVAGIHNIPLSPQYRQELMDKVGDKIVRRSITTH